jgi:hypothetical protein
MTDTVYRYLTTRKDIHWFCSECEVSALRAIKRDQQVEDSCQEYFQKVTSRIERIETLMVKKVDQDDLSVALEFSASEINRTVKTLVDHKLKNLSDRLEKKLDEVKHELIDDMKNKIRNASAAGLNSEGGKLSWADAVSKEVDSKIHDVTAEVTVLKQQAVEMQMEKDENEEIIRRKNSVIIHGLCEPEGNSGEDRKRNDEERIVDMLHHLRCDEISISNCVRLGKQPTDQNTKPRPIKLVVVSEGQKDKLLYSAKNLRGRSGLNGVFIHQDLTPAQRERRHRLVEELKLRQTQGEQNLIIIGNKIVQRRNTWTKTSVDHTAQIAEQV